MGMRFEKVIAIIIMIYVLGNDWTKENESYKVGVLIILIDD